MTVSHEINRKHIVFIKQSAPRSGTTALRVFHNRNHVKVTAGLQSFWYQRLWLQNGDTVLVPPTPSKTVGTPCIHDAGKVIIMPFRRSVKPSGTVFARLVLEINSSEINN